MKAVNTALIDLYWQIGSHISRKIATAGWGKGTIEKLSAAVRQTHAGITGFSPQNLWRMRQFFEAYPEQDFVSAVLSQLPWTHNMIILGQAKHREEREFYLRMSIREQWSSRELERQFKLASFERAVLAPPIVPPAVSELHAKAADYFKDSYVVEFLSLPEQHSEQDLHRGLHDGPADSRWSRALPNCSLDPVLKAAGGIKKMLAGKFRLKKKRRP